MTRIRLVLVDGMYTCISEIWFWAFWGRGFNKPTFLLHSVTAPWNGTWELWELWEFLSTWFGVGLPLPAVRRWS